LIRQNFVAALEYGLKPQKIIKDNRYKFKNHKNLIKPAFLIKNHQKQPVINRKLPKFSKTEILELKFTKI
jgi:hypothetical protein